MEGDAKRRAPIGKMVVALIVVVLLVVILLMPATQNFLRDNVFGVLRPSYAETVDMNYTRTITVSASSGPINKVSVTLPEAVNVTMNGLMLQRVDSIISDPAPTKITYQQGIPILTWERLNIPQGSSYVIKITYNERINTTVWTIRSQDAGTVDQFPAELKLRYLGTEWKIMPDDPLVISTANSIAAGKTNVLDIQSALYSWITSNIAYPAQSSTSGAPKSPADTITSRIGDCDDTAVLFCSMARHLGIPSWLQLGMLYDRNTGSVGGHGWIQTYVPLAAGGGQYVTIDCVNSEFLIYKANRMVDYTDNGNGTDLYNFYYYLSYNSAYDLSFSDRSVMNQYSESSNRVYLSFEAQAVIRELE
jgi:transglutaminase-like putative cysteine protease